MKKRIIIRSLALAFIAMLFITSTILAVAPITNFTVIPTDTTASLSWTKASGLSKTVIRYLTTAYPTDPTGVADNSTLAYPTGSSGSTGYSYIATGLTPGTTYYWSAWGWDGAATYSTNATNFVATTSGSITTTNLPNPTLPSNFNQTPSSSAWFDRLQPFTGILSAFFNDWGMPKDNGFLLMSTLIMVFGGVVTYFATKNLFVAYAVVMALDLASIYMHMMYGWSIFILIAIALGIWGVERAYQ